MSNSNVFDRVVGSDMYVTIDLTRKLATGEVLSATPTLTLSNTHITEDAGTKALDGTARMFSVRFTHVSAGTTRVDYSVPTTGPTETITDFFFVRTIAPSAVP